MPDIFGILKPKARSAMDRCANRSRWWLQSWSIRRTATSPGKDDHCQGMTNASILKRDPWNVIAALEEPLLIADDPCRRQRQASSVKQPARIRSCIGSYRPIISNMSWGSERSILFTSVVLINGVTQAVVVNTSCCQDRDAEPLRPNSVNDPSRMMGVKV